MHKFNFEEILERIKTNISVQYRKDPEFRMNIVLSQLGDVAHFITHDQKINPPAREYKIERHEEDSFGHALVNLLMLAQMRDIDIEKALELALNNIEDADWKKKTAKNGKGGHIRGQVAHPGDIIGEAFVDSSGKNLHELKDHILIIHHARPTLVMHASRIKGIVTDQGGKFSHAAILAREHNIPCIVATENATDLIKHGQRIRIKAEDPEKDGIVYLNVLT